jgi:hypothetical protein
MKTLTPICVSLMLSGCVPFLVNGEGKGRKTEPCEVWVYDNQGHAQCMSREHMRKWPCEQLGVCGGGR